MDYLVTEGYKTAADEFCKEANMPTPVGLNRIDKRIVIRDAVQRGDIQEAIQHVNEFNPEVHWRSISLSPLSLRIKTFHAPLSDLRVGDEIQNQNFSLQYDLFFVRLSSF